MVTPGQALWNTLRDAYDSAIAILVSNLLWLLLTLPLVTAPAAAVGAYTNSFRLAANKPADTHTFFAGIRKYGWAGYRFFLINLVVVALLTVNFLFYGRFQERWATWAQGIVIGLGIIWLALNVFTFPLYLAQSEKKYLTALRNSLVFYLRMPGMCISLLSFLLAFMALSTLLTVSWLLFSTILILMLCCRFTILMLESMGYPQEELHFNVDTD